MGISVRKDKDGFIMVKEIVKTSNYDKCVESPPYEFYDDPIYGDEKKAKVHSMSFEQLTPKTQQIMYKNMTFEGLQQFYLPLLAKLQILEKRYFVGIIDHDIKLVEKEFDFLIRTINHKDIKILTADFYSKVGDILYYKNRVFSGDRVENEDITSSKGIKISHYACYYYKKAFIALILAVDKRGEVEKEEEFYEKTIMQILEEKATFIYEKTSAKYCSVMARVLSNLGDVYFSAKKGMCKGCKLDIKGCKFNICHKKNCCKKLGEGYYVTKENYKNKGP
jgi:hypothetical protein